MYLNTQNKIKAIKPVVAAVCLHCKRRSGSWLAVNTEGKLAQGIPTRDGASENLFALQLTDNP